MIGFGDEYVAPRESRDLPIAVSFNGMRSCVGGDAVTGERKGDRRSRREAKQFRG